MRQYVGFIMSFGNITQICILFITKQELKAEDILKTQSQVKSQISSLLLRIIQLLGLFIYKEAQTPPFDAFVKHNYAEIIDFITTAAYRKKGIGSKLMDAAKQWAKERNLNYIELFVLSDAQDEYSFYEHKGFVTVSQTMRCPL